MTEDTKLYTKLTREVWGEIYRVESGDLPNSAERKHELTNMIGELISYHVRLRDAWIDKHPVIKAMLTKGLSLHCEATRMPSNFFPTMITTKVKYTDYSGDKSAFIETNSQISMSLFYHSEFEREAEAGFYKAFKGLIFYEA